MSGTPPAGGQDRASRRIRILREDVANRIAAGEVIDRPLSVLRELLDNALDSGATTVDVWMERGGLDLIRVLDDGWGMERADLELCYQPHTTSKIENLADLDRATTLGFRGEALSSIAVSATLEIVSRTREQQAACRLRVRDGTKALLETCAGNPGTDTRVTGLFEHLPARRAFLRSASAESALCSATFLDKALAHPGVAFRLYSNGELRHRLGAGSQVERVLHAYPELESAGLETVELSAIGVKLTGVFGRPEAARKDRRMVQVFVNGRRIWEYALVQAAEHGYSGTIPGGLHPVAFVFLRLDPALADFNIHPAKREARFRDPGTLHRLVVEAARRRVSAPLPRMVPHSVAAPGVVSEATLPWSAPASASPLAVPEPEARSVTPDVEEPASGAGFQTQDVVYHGQVFGVFLIAQWRGSLYLIDQHAAHERIIFDRLMRDAPTVQELLLPISFQVDASEAEQLERSLPGLAEAGVVVERGAGRSFEVTALDERLKRIPEDRLVDTIRGRRGDRGSIRRELCTLAACNTAVREGERLDPVTGADLARAALALPEPRCPHGRPLWREITRRELYRAVLREI